MPQAIPLLVQTALQYAGAKAIVVAAATLVATIAVGAYESRKQRKAVARAQAEARAGLTVMVRSAVVPRRLTYGEVELSGPIAFAHSTGSSNNTLHLVIPLCDGPITAIDEVFLNDEPAGTLDAGGWATDARWRRSETEFFSQFATADASGNWAITLDRVPNAVIRVSTNPSGLDEASTGLGYSWSAGSANVSGSGAPPLQQVIVGYTALRPYGQFLRIRKYLGDVNQTADVDLIAASNGKWTTAHRLRGIAYLWVTLVRDEVVFPQGLPNIKARVRGRAVFDPRTSLTTYSVNPALHKRDYLLTQMGVPATEINDLEVIASANVCEEQIAIGTLDPDNGTGFQPRFTCNTVIEVSNTPQQIIEQLNTADAGFVAYSEGRWNVVSRYHRAPVATLTDLDFTERISVTEYQPIDQAFNAGRGTFISRAKDFQPTDFPPVVVSAYVSEDQGVLYRDFDLPCTLNAVEAQRTTKLVIERARRGGVIQARCNLRQAFALQVGDVVAVTLLRFGFVSRLYEVREWAFDFGGEVELLLQATDATLYGWTAGNAAALPPAQGSTLPNPFARPAPLSITAISSGTAFARRRSDGIQVQGLGVSWTQHPSSFVTAGGSIEWEYRRNQDSDWSKAPSVRGADTSIVIEPVQVGEVVLLRGRARAALGQPSDWQYASHLVAGPNSSVGDTILAGGKGVNLLDNASLKYGPQEWLCQFGDGTPRSIVNGGDVTLAINGGTEFFQVQNGFGTSPALAPAEAPRPLGTLRFFDSSGVTYGDLIGSESGRTIYSRNAVPCLPGERLEIQCRAMAQSSVAGGFAGRIRVGFYNSTGAYIGETIPTGGPTLVNNNEDFTGIDTISNWKHLWGFIEAPASAHSARFFWKPIKLASAAGGARFAMPYLGRAHAGQTQPSPWTGDQSVGTGLIESNAATDVYSFTFSDVAGINGAYAQLLQTFVFTLQPGWTLELSTQGTLFSVNNGAGGPVTKTWQEVYAYVQRPDLSIVALSGVERRFGVEGVVAAPLSARTYQAASVETLTLKIDIGQRASRNSGTYEDMAVKMVVMKR